MLQNKPAGAAKLLKIPSRKDLITEDSVERREGWRVILSGKMAANKGTEAQLKKITVETLEIKITVSNNTVRCYFK